MKLHSKTNAQGKWKSQTNSFLSDMSLSTCSSISCRLELHVHSTIVLTIRTFVHVEADPVRHTFLLSHILASLPRPHDSSPEQPRTRQLTSELRSHARQPATATSVSLHASC